MNYTENPVKLRAWLDFIRFELNLPDGTVICRDEHDISSPRDLDNRLTELAAKHQPLTIRPIAVELALDAFHETDDLDVLANFATHTWRMHTTVIGRQRLYRMKGERVSAVPEHGRLTSALQDSWQLAEGNAWDNVMRHGYLKMTDDAARQTVRPRARLEIRLQGDACPFQSLDELRAFDWCSLAHYFKFRRLKHDLDSFSQLLADHSTTVGKRTPRTIAGSKRLYSPMTTADSALNRRYRDALLTLSRRWKRTTEPTTSQPDIAQKRGNKSGNCGQNRAATRAVTGSPLITSSEQQEQVSPQQHSNQPQQHQQPTSQAPNPTTEQPQDHREAGHTAYKGTTEQDGAQRRPRSGLPLRAQRAHPKPTAPAASPGGGPNNVQPNRPQTNARSLLLLRKRIFSINATLLHSTTKPRVLEPQPHIATNPANAHHPTTLPLHSRHDQPPARAHPAPSTPTSHPQKQAPQRRRIDFQRLGNPRTTPGQKKRL
ncbi:hypothetical protein ACFQ4M_12075 [Thauera mechernichensis]|uniref:Uncharacterized protein n=1 Tax=Thauera mechernichensis TaxID=82788 RepID=A0ABW3WE89_9RHOO|nr:hypothetical protein [Thauera mechernichensis]MDG3063891.1 hypothetical protein [Thauera mechernichensis]